MDTVPLLKVIQGVTSLISGLNYSMILASRKMEQFKFTQIRFYDLSSPWTRVILYSAT